MHQPIRLIVFTVFIVALCASQDFGVAQEAKARTQPNILWIYLEDTSPLMGPYGFDRIATPNIDELAEAGTVFTRAYAPAPVCSPSRSAVITGKMATSLGLHNHHSSRTEESAIFLPEGYRTIPELFRSAGYFTFNSGKDDYNFHYDRRDLYEHGHSLHRLYGMRGDRVDLATLTDKQPFFGQVQLGGGKEIFSKSFASRVKTPVERSRIQLPPYLPDHPVIVEEYADHLDAIQLTDIKVGRLVDEMRTHGLLENTIVFFFSDHGMRLTRHKQFLYEGGLHIPLIVADFREHPTISAGARVDGLVSGLDVGTSSLAVAGIPIPTDMEGINFFAKDFRGRKFVVATRDRCDFTIDRIRSIRTQRFKYIRNFMTDRPYTQPTYMDVDGVEFVRVMRTLAEADELNPAQASFFSKERPAEELYDLESDPYELNNLAETDGYESTRAEHAALLSNWVKTSGDRGQHPEDEAGLHLMLGIWGEHAINPEYEPLRRRNPKLAGSLLSLKTGGWERIPE